MTMATVTYKRRMFPVQFLKARPVVWSWVTTVIMQVSEWLNRAKFREKSDFRDIFFQFFTFTFFLKSNPHRGTTSTPNHHNSPNPRTKPRWPVDIPRTTITTDRKLVGLLILANVTFLRYFPPPSLTRPSLIPPSAFLSSPCRAAPQPAIDPASLSHASAM